MLVFDLRKELKTKAKHQSIDSADVDFIMAEVLGVKHTELSLVGEVDVDSVAKIREAFSLRLEGKPVDKIFGKAYFYGLEFVVDENVLTPRPETELLVEIAVKEIEDNNYKTALDLCTGSGCIAIAIAKNSNVDITASDISAKALKIAKQNAKNNNVNINFIKSNMFSEIDGKFDLIVSNPPYIATEDIEGLDEEVKNHDPRLALDGGELGLKYYNIIHENLRKKLNENGTLIMEIGDEQRDLIMSLFTDFKLVHCIKDLSGNDRIIIVKN